jgi:SAM-dependent methyltransferase
VDLLERRAGVTRRHPWEQARAALFRRILRTSGLTSEPVRALDVGAGDGWLAGRLALDLPPGSTMTCWDTAYTDADLAEISDSAPDGISFTREAPEGLYDLLLCLDVVEHVADDVTFMTDLVSQRLRPGGLVLASVPAWQPLFSAHDEALRHHRRYAPGAFRRLLEGAGIEVVRDGGMFSSLLLPRAATVVRERLRGRTPVTGAVEGVGAWTSGPTATSVLTAALTADGALGETASRVGLRVPGLSHWVLGRRP